MLFIQTWNLNQGIEVTATGRIFLNATQNPDKLTTRLLLRPDSEESKLKTWKSLGIAWPRPVREAIRSNCFITRSRSIGGLGVATERSGVLRSEYQAGYRRSTVPNHSMYQSGFSNNFVVLLSTASVRACLASDRKKTLWFSVQRRSLLPVLALPLLLRPRHTNPTWGLPCIVGPGPCTDSLKIFS